MKMNSRYFVSGTFWYGVGIIGSQFLGSTMFFTCCLGLLLMFLGARGNGRGNKKSKGKDCSIEEEW